MSNVEFTIDGIPSIEQIFNSLEMKKQKKAVSGALRGAMSVLTSRARRNLKRAIKNANRVTLNGRFKGFTPTKGIKWKVAKDGFSIKVNILSDPRLKWFELGTKVRYTRGKRRKLHSTGSIKPTNFFSNAKRDTESKVIQQLNESLEKQIIKLWNKK